MASSINASTAGAGGVITTADNSGVLQVQTAGTTALTISAAQAATFANTVAATTFNGAINGTVGATTPSTGAFTTLSASSTVSGTGITNLFASPPQIGTTTASVGYFTAFQTTGSRSYMRSQSDQFALGLAWNSVNGYCYIGASASPTPDMIFSNYAGVESARILNAGTFCVGTTSIPNVSSPSGYGFSVSSTEVVIAKAVASCALYVKNASSAGSVAMIFYNGEVQAGYIVTTNTSTTTYNSGSDYRLKESVQPLTNALSTVAKLKPSTYKWKVDGSEGQGFIAHELQEVFPLAVTGEKDAVDEDGKPKLQGVDQSKLVVLLTAALQELNAKVDAQAAEIAALKGV